MYSTFWIQQNNNIIWFGKLLVTGRQIVIFKMLSMSPSGDVTFYYNLEDSFGSCTIASTSTNAPRGKEATPTVLLAGYGVSKNVFITSLTCAKLSILVTKMLTLITSFNVAPDDSTTAFMLVNDCCACSVTESETIVPLSGLRPICPER
ncbi:hypothetical protein BLOT_004918 [Blomia tropicalis]|nr:hypothetical protein BLOT_004918 [Blomia tropicalis]